MEIARKEQEFLELIAVSIDFPCSHIERFTCSRRTVYSIIEKLVDAEYIRRFRKHLILSLRLTQKGQAYLMNQNSERFGDKRRYCKSDKGKRIRIHRIAEAYLMLRNVGIKIYKDEKPDLFKCDETITEELAPQICSPCFYSSLEIKDQGDEYIKINATRAVGILLINNKHGYFIYNMAYMSMRWSSRSEQKLEGVITGTLLSKYIYIKEWAAIMIGNDMEIAIEQLASNGGYNNNYFRLDNTYNEFYFVPDSIDGELIIRILCNNEIRQKLRNSILDKFERINRELPYANDGVTEDDKVILLAYEFDMEKIKCFQSGIEMFGDDAIVVCFEFQKDVLGKYFEGRVEIKVIDSKMVARKWFGGK